MLILWIPLLLHPHLRLVVASDYQNSTSRPLMVTFYLGDNSGTSSLYKFTTVAISHEKLVYLQQALKGGNAMSLIEGLSRSGEHC